MLKLIVCTVLAVLLCACASNGREINQEDVARIKVGTTTVSDMNRVFGPPLSQGYSSDGKLTMTWHYVYVGPFGTDMLQQILAVLFDADGKVEKYNLTQGNPGATRLGR